MQKHGKIYDTDSYSVTPGKGGGQIAKPDLFYFYTLHNCISFAKYQNESATSIHVFPTMNPPPSSLPIPSLWVVPVQ